MTTSPTSSDTAAKKDVQKLQRAIVDGLEDVKAQDIVVFNTEHLSSLFERVIIASGTSNRQTKALASSVRDAVREAGFPKPRIEGEDNGEWIIVDCGAAVAHIMQPSIRQYYHLEEIWGDKPVRLKFGAVKPAQPEAEKPETKKTAPAKTSLRRSSAVKTAEKEAKHAAEQAARKPAPSKRGAVSKAPARSRAATPVTAAAKAPAKAPVKAAKVVVVKPASKAAPKSAAKTAGKPAAPRKTARAPAKTTAKKAAR